MANFINSVEIADPELEMLKLNKESGYNYRHRREEQWNENYMLYRNVVKVNRLTQRQSVTLPLMKQTIITKLKDLDDMPIIYLESLDNDKDEEILINDYWEYTIGTQCNNMEIKDVIDKKQEMLFGRTFDQMQIEDGKVRIRITDPMDIIIDRFTDPSDIDTARSLVHTHIFRPLSALSNNEDYNKEAVKKLQEYYATQQGIIKSEDNLNSMTSRNKKLRDLGVPDIESPVLGETYVEISLHFVYREKDEYVNDEGKTIKVENQFMMYVECDNMAILMKKPLDVVIGKTKDDYWQTHLPYNSWAEDSENQDFWSDGTGDVVRPSAKILNVWFSQLVENRTMRSFGMNYFDSTIEGFTAPTIEPEPWGWVGVPGNPNEVFKKVDIPDLSESLDEMEFVLTINDRATGATATQQGVPTERQITLGEVKLALSEAKETNKGISKFYTVAWMKRAEKFLKFIEAAPDKLDSITVNKKGRNSSDIWSRDISPSDWKWKNGYRVKIWSQDQKDNDDIQQLQKLTTVRAMIPGNSKLEEIIQRKALEFADLKPDEINDIIRIEDEKRAAMQNSPLLQGGAGMQQNGLPPRSPQPALPPPAPVPQPVA